MAIREEFVGELDLEGLSDREVVDVLERHFDEVVEEVREGVEAVSESARAFAELGAVSGQPKSSTTPAERQEANDALGSVLNQAMSTGGGGS